MLNYDVSRLEKSCRELAGAFKNQVSWKWDGRFETALAEFGVADKEPVCRILKTQMGFIWDDHNSGNLPERVQMIIDCFDGLNPGQLLFTSDPDREDLVLCAWWPWGNGRTISIRLGVFVNSLDDDGNEELTQLLRGWLGL